MAKTKLQASQSCFTNLCSSKKLPTLLYLQNSTWDRSIFARFVNWGTCCVAVVLMEYILKTTRRSVQFAEGPFCIHLPLAHFRFLTEQLLRNLPLKRSKQWCCKNTTSLRNTLQ